MRKFAIFCLATMVSVGASADEKYKLGNPDASQTDGRILLTSMYQTRYALGGIFTAHPGVTIKVTTVYSEKEDDTADDSDRTIGCYGKTEAEAILCSEELATIIEETMSDPSHWNCESIPQGAECTHVPH